jgi:uncharacterized protein
MISEQLTKEEIISFLKQNKNFIREHFHVNKIAIFGSFARDEQNSKSDIDLLIEIEENTQNIFEMKNELRQYISSHLHRNVDLAREKYLKPYAKETILNEAVRVE